MTNRAEPKLSNNNSTSILMECMFAAFLFLSCPLHAQSLNSDHDLADAIEHAINTLPSSQLAIYNGRYYTPPAITAAGHPYFPTAELEQGTISYDGIQYNDIYLTFDASLQCVIIEDYAGNKICPVEQKITSFTIGAHTFRRISDVPGLATGFYDVLVDGKLFARRTKTGGGMQWKSSTEYYFVDNGKVFQLSNKKSVLEGMPDRESDIRQFIRNNKLSFGNSKEKSLIEVVQYYLSLKHK